MTEQIQAHGPLLREDEAAHAANRYFVSWCDSWMLFSVHFCVRGSLDTAFIRLWQPVNQQGAEAARLRARDGIA